MQPKVRLRIFSYQIIRLMTDMGNFSLTPLPGLKLQVSVKETKRTLPNGQEYVTGLPNVSDTVVINGQCCGNRYGAVEEYTRIVAETNPEFVFP